MSIANDIKEVLQEVGTALTIHRSNGDTVSDIFVDPTAYPDQSTLFIRMFLRSGSLSADTPVRNGDMVEFGGTYFLVTNLVPTHFENDIVENIAVFYRCNQTVEVFKHVDNPGYDANYEKLSEWTSLGADVPACIVEKQLIQTPDVENEAYLSDSITNIVYLSSVYEVARGDRVSVSNGRNYMIETVSRYELDGIFVCGVTEDHR